MRRAIQPMQVTSAAVSPNWMFFGYDPLGRCVKRWTGALTADGKVPPIGSNPATYFYYDGWNLVQEGSSVTSPSRFYVHGARVDEIVKQITMPNKWERYFHYEGRGHCAFQTDIWGNIVEQYEYDAFGQPYFYNASGTNIGSSGWGNRFLFTGREYLSELKLYDYRNRMYQPELGRFFQPDPKHFAAGDYNLYRYCHNDPVNHTDPTGLDATRDFIAGIGNALTFDQAEKVAEFFYPGYIASVDKSSAAYRFALPVGIAIGMADGTGEAAAAKAATGKLFGSTSKVTAKIEKQLAEHGEKSLEKSLSSFEKRIAEHMQKIEQAKAAGGNTSSMQRELRAFQKEREAIKEVLKRKK